MADSGATRYTAIYLIFGIMLTGRITHPDMPTQNRQALASAFFCFILFVCTAYILVNRAWNTVEQANVVSVEEIGVGLLQKYVLPFEIISVATFNFLMAPEILRVMIKAAAKDSSKPKPQSTFAALKALVPMVAVVPVFSF